MSSVVVLKHGESVWTVDTKSKKDSLGAGSFARVFRGKDQHGALVAVKVVNVATMPSNSRHYLDQEIETMAKFNHPNIVRMFHAEKRGEFIYLVLEYCAGGDLRNFVTSQPNRRLDEETSRHFMLQMASGLRYLYDERVLHRDLKPHNLLLTSRSSRAQLKICDFGFAREVPAGDVLMQSFLGSPLYMAPELLHRRSYDDKSDLWSVGCILYEMLTGRTPFDNVRDIEQLKIAVSKRQIKLDVPVSDACRDLLSKLLKAEHDERLGWPEFFEHPFLKTNTNAPLSSYSVILTDNGVEAGDLGMGAESTLSPLQEIPKGAAEAREDSWLQNIYCFHDHGRILNLYVKRQDKVGFLKQTIHQLAGVWRDSQLLLDFEGNELIDDKTLEYYKFHETQSPMYLVNRESLETKLKPERIEFAPHAVKEDAQSIKEGAMFDKIIKSDFAIIVEHGESPEQRFDLIKLFYDVIVEKIQYLYWNMRARSEHYRDARIYQDAQIKVYLTLRSFCVNLVSETKSSLSSLDETFRLLRETLLKGYLDESSGIVHRSLEELKEIKLHPNLGDSGDESPKSLFEAMGLEVKKKLAEELATSWLSMESEFGDAEKSFNENDARLQEVMDCHIQNNPLEKIDAINRKSSEITTEIRPHLTKVTQLAAVVFNRVTAVGSFKVTHEIVDEVVAETLSKMRGLVALMERLKEAHETIESFKEDVIEARFILEQYFYDLTYRVSQIIGFCKVMSGDIRKLQEKLIEWESQASELRKVQNIRSNYEECLSELARRKRFNDGLMKSISISNELLTKEFIRRDEFDIRHSGEILPMFEKWLGRNQCRDESDVAPTLSKLVANVDEEHCEFNNVPDVTDYVATEDEFSFVSDDANSPERLADLEKENADLHRSIRFLTQALKQRNDMNEELMQKLKDSEELTRQLIEQLEVK